MASLAQAQWRNKHVRRSADAFFSEPPTVDSRKLLPIVESPSRFLSLAVFRGLDDERIRLRSCLQRRALCVHRRSVSLTPDGGLTQPLLEADLSESRVAGGNERTLAKLSPEVPRVRIDDHLARVVACAESLTDQFIETELLGAGHFNGAIHWRGDGYPGDCLGDIVGGHRLNEHRWQANRCSYGGFIGDAPDEFEELRRVDDRVRDPGSPDQRFLSVHRSEVGTVGYPLGSHHGKRHVVLHAGSVGGL